MNTEIITETSVQNTQTGSTSSSQNLLDFGPVLSRSWNRFMESFVRLLGVFGISILAVIACVALFAVLIVPFFFIDSLLAKPPIIIVGILLLLALLVFVSWIFAAINALYIKTLDNKQVPVFSLLKQSFDKGWGILIIGAVTGLALISGYLLFIIPGIILSCFFWFAYTVYVVENVSWLHALKVSVFLVRKEFAKIFTVFFLVFVAVIALSILLGFVEPLGFIFSILTTLFMPVLVYELYVSVKSLYPQSLDDARNEQLVFVWVFAGLSVLFLCAFMTLVVYFGLLNPESVFWILDGMNTGSMLGDIPFEDVQNDVFNTY